MVGAQGCRGPKRTPLHLAKTTREGPSLSPSGRAWASLPGRWRHLQAPWSAAASASYPETQALLLSLCLPDVSQTVFSRTRSWIQ